MLHAVDELYTMEREAGAEFGTAQRRRQRTPRREKSVHQPPHDGKDEEPGGSSLDPKLLRARPGPSGFSLLFADSEREYKARFWKMSRTMSLSTTATLVLLVARLIQFGPVAFSAGPRDIGWIAAVSRIAAFAAALACLAPIWGFGFSSPSKQSAAASSTATVRRSEIGTYCIMAGEGLGAAVYAASTGGPPPGSISAFAYGAIASGMPWYSHTLFAVATLGAYLLAQGHVVVAVDQEIARVDILLDTLQNIAFGGLCSYMADRHLRAEYQTHERLREFRSALDVAVEELSRSPSAPESLQAMDAPHRATERRRGSSDGRGNKGKGDDTFCSSDLPQPPDRALLPANTPSTLKKKKKKLAFRCECFVGALAIVGRTVKQAVLCGVSSPKKQLLAGEARTDLVDNINTSLARALAVCNLYSQSESRQAFFLAMMSHELRSPLTALLGCADLLLMTTGLGDDANDLAALIKSSGGYLLNIVNDILDFSKITSADSDFSLDTTDFDPALLAKSVASMFLPQSMSKNIRFSVKFDSKSLPAGTMLNGDSTRIEQIIVNFLSNAFKFTPSGGTVTLTIKAFPDESRLMTPRSDSAEVDFFEEKRPKSAAAARTARQPIVLEVGVSDNGVGMSKETQSALFKPFSQGMQGVTRKFGGTGLGLCICAQLVAQMGGDKILVDSELGVGSTFRARLHLEAVFNDRAAGGFTNVHSMTGEGPQAPDTPGGPMHGTFAHHRRHTVVVRQEQMQKAHPSSALEPGGEGGDDDDDDDFGKRDEDVTWNYFGSTGQQSRSVLGHRTTGRSSTSLHTDLSPGVSREAAQGDDSVQSHKSPPSAMGAAAGSAPLCGLRILLVEDVKSIRMVAKRLLTNAGAHVTTAVDGNLATAAVVGAASQGNPFDCVIMDFHMPNLDGAEATIEIHRRLSDKAPPVIGASADVLNAATNCFLDAGAVAVVSKPFDMKKVIRVVLEHCGAAEASGATRTD